MLKEHIAFIFRGEEYAKQETSTTQAAGSVLLAACFILVSCLEVICPSKISVHFIGLHGIIIYYVEALSPTTSKKIKKFVNS
jgi:hypothetical protein